MPDCERDHLFRHVWENIPAAQVEFTPLWPVILVALAATISLLAAGAWLATRRPDYHSYYPDEPGSEWYGLRGLLMPFSLLVLVWPVLLLLRMACRCFLFDKVVLTALTDMQSPVYNTWWYAGIPLYIFFQCFNLAAAFLLVYCLIKKRRFFRTLAITMLILLNGELLFKDFVLSQVFPKEHLAINENLAALTTVMKASFALLPYLLLSRRVHATFRH